MIHVKPKDENLYPLYSVEYIRKDAHFNCWSQFGLTSSRHQMVLMRAEVWLRYRRGYNRRVRVF